MRRAKKAAELIKLVESLAVHEYDFTQQYHVCRFSDMERSPNPQFIFTGTEADAWDFVKAQGDPDLVVVNDAGIQFPLPAVDAGDSLVGQPPAASLANVTPTGEW